MTYRKSKIWFGLLLLAGIVYAASRLAGRQGPPSLSLPDPVDHVAQATAGEVKASAHPLDPALKIARKCLENIETNIQDYSADLIKRERVDGKLGEVDQIFVKIRQEPFSVYTYFKLPESLKGQWALYVEGKNNGDMIAQGAGIQGLIGPVHLKPDGLIAMRGQRYPITEIGILNLTKRLIEVAEQDRQHDECEVKFFKEAKINKRLCTCIEVTHPTKRPYFRFYKARVFVDDKMNIPVRYEAYDWPSAPGDEPPLLEEYTYTDVKLNNGFTDADFEPK
jgi:hypothetical protein